MTWPFAAPSCASSSTSLSAFLNTNNPSTPPLFLFLKPFDTQDRIYKAHEIGTLRPPPGQTLLHVSMDDCVDRSCPKTSRLFIPEERKFQPASAKQVPGLKRGGKGKSASGNPHPASRPI